MEAVSLNTHAYANGIASWQILPYKFFVNDADLRGCGAVMVIEGAPSQERNSQRRAFNLRPLAG